MRLGWFRKSRRAPAEPGSAPERRSLEWLLDLVVCPNCRSKLQHRGEALRCDVCLRTYRLLGGVPVLRDGEVTVMPADHVSNALNEDVAAWLDGMQGPTLNLGAGATDRLIRNCVQLEYSIFRTTDVVGDAHRLPFPDGLFEAIVTFNTFEHLRDPATAARELYRVMKPGGRLMLQTAYLQPLHEEPHHYFPVTEWGLRQWFDGFQIDRLFVPENMNPSLALAWLASEILHHTGVTLGRDVSERLAGVTLGEWRALWNDKEARQGSVLWQSMMKLPQETQSRFSAGFQLEATKPET